MKIVYVFTIQHVSTKTVETREFDSMASLRKAARALYGDPTIKFTHLISKHFCEKIINDIVDSLSFEDDLNELDLFDPKIEDSDLVVDRDNLKKGTSIEDLVKDLDDFFRD